MGAVGHDRMVVAHLQLLMHNQCLTPLNLWVRIPIRRGFTRYNIMW